MPPKQKKQQRRDEQTEKDGVVYIRDKEKKAKRYYRANDFKEAFNNLQMIFLSSWRVEYKSPIHASFFRKPDEQGELRLFRDIFEVAVKAKVEFSLLLHALSSLLNYLLDPAHPLHFTKDKVFPELFALDGGSRYVLRFLSYRESQVCEYLTSLQLGAGSSDITEHNADAMSGLVAVLLNNPKYDDTTSRFLDCDLIIRGIITRFYYGAKNEYERIRDKDILGRILNTPAIFSKFSRYIDDICRIVAMYPYYKDLAYLMLSTRSIYNSVTFTWPQLFMLFRAAKIVNTVEDFNKSTHKKLLEILRLPSYKDLSKEIVEGELPIPRDEDAEQKEEGRRELLVKKIMNRIREVISLPSKQPFSLISIEEALEVGEEFMPILPTKASLSSMGSLPVLVRWKNRVSGKNHVYFIGAQDANYILLTENQKSSSAYDRVQFPETYGIEAKTTLSADDITEFMCMRILQKGGNPFLENLVEAVDLRQLKTNVVMVGFFEEELKMQLEQGREILREYLQQRFWACGLSEDASSELFIYILRETSDFRGVERRKIIERAKVSEDQGEKEGFLDFLRSPWRS